MRSKVRFLCVVMTVILIILPIIAIMDSNNKVSHKDIKKPIERKEVHPVIKGR